LTTVIVGVKYLLNVLITLFIAVAVILSFELGRGIETLLTFP
jgi:hypothetical protein